MLNQLPSKQSYIKTIAICLVLECLCRNYIYEGNGNRLSRLFDSIQQRLQPSVSAFAMCVEKY